MKIFGIIAGLIVALAGLFLAMFANPVGWIIVLVGVFAMAVALIRANLKGERTRLVRNVHSHGPEDRGRGDNSDQMMR